ncbi:MAG: polysaccharide biosynthesis/export family protein [Cyclobacteriaceae bacterium]|nr:polysaccharide biosynthesis/export family protein [Cyclobacteriaceae bacterium]
MKHSFILVSLAGLFLFLGNSCASYKQNIMFKVGDNTIIQVKAEEAEKNYVIQRNDLLKLKVFTSKGELIVDPDLKLLKDIPAQTGNLRPDPEYLVNINGIAKFPMVGELKVEGLTIRQAEAILQKAFTEFYSDPFVILTFTNKRVIVLGDPGGQLIPLVNDNVSLVEILAAASGLTSNGKAHNIRVLRGEQVYVADFSTIEGYQKSNMIMQPGDIVYVEPIRRPASEALRDYGIIVSMFTSLTTLIIVISSL